MHIMKGTNMCEHHNHNEEHCHCEHSRKNNIVLVRVAFAVILILAAFVFQMKEYTALVVFGTSYLIAGGDILYKAFKNILKGDVFDENFLMGIATLGAFVIKEYPEAVMVMVFYQLGEFLQHRAVEKSCKSITDLMDIRPDYANIERNGNFVKVNPAEVKTGDIIAVKPGEKIPLDGIVVEGAALVEAAALTGESVPVSVKVDDHVLSGCINTNGFIKVSVSKPFHESTVSKILELVEHAADKKTKTENFITKFARYYTPIVVALAVLLAVVPPLFVQGAEFSDWFSRALTFLVISCPCALVISVPLSFFAGIGGASRQGILIKGSNYLEVLSKLETVVFDKTGTLTKGSFAVSNIIPVNDSITQETILKYSASAEVYSNHPVAAALKSAYKEVIDTSKVSCVSEFAGYGIKAVVAGDEIIVGNAAMMEKFNITFEKISESGTVVYIAKNGEYLGCIVITDEIKPDSVIAINNLKKKVKNIVMLTGDSAAVAMFVSAKLGINQVFASLLPADKVEMLEQIINTKSKNKTVAFVGDGINDAPVLSLADAGIAMGALGSDAAIEAADVVIMDDKPSKVAQLIDISKKTMSIVKQNIVFALSIKVLFLMLGAFGLITMWGAVFADVGVTFIAILNALRALHSTDFIKE